MNERAIIHWRSFLGLAKVRLIQARPGGAIYIPIADLATAIGYARQWVRDAIRRNGEDFFGAVVSIFVGAHDAPLRASFVGNHGGPLCAPLVECLEPPFEFDENHGTWRPTRLACLTYEGVVGLLMMLETRRIKDPSKRARVRTFRHWAQRLVARAILTVPVEQLPADLVDIVELRPGRETGKAVVDLAAKAGKSPRTVYRHLETARNLKGKAPRGRRSDRAEVRRPEEAARVLEHLRVHRRARLRNLVALETGLSRWTLYRMLKEFRQVPGRGKIVEVCAAPPRDFLPETP